jgi:hypothetical protein
MATQKAAPKAAKKGSKLASLKSAIFGMGKAKVDSVQQRGTKKPAAGKSSPSAPGKAAAGAGKKDVKPQEKATQDKAPQNRLKDKKGAPSAAAPASAPAKGAPKKGAPSVPAAANGAASKTAQGGRKGKAAKETAPRERMAGPSIRVSYDANGEAVCREVACEGLATSAGYCRMHYIKNWKKIKRKEVILKEGKLNQYIEELVAKYPDKYIEAIRQDLASDKDFAKVIYDLDLDESVDDFEVEGENVDQIIDTIKRDFDDEGEGF